MTGMELLKRPDITAGEIADIISGQCPPVTPENCDDASCRDCWLAWLVGEGTKEKGPPNQRTAPSEEGLHPNLIGFLRKQDNLIRTLEDVRADVTADFPGHTDQ